VETWKLAKEAGKQRAFVLELPFESVASGRSGSRARGSLRRAPSSCWGMGRHGDGRRHEMIDDGAQSARG
jgi:hypothetical protein